MTNKPFVIVLQPAVQRLLDRVVTELKSGKLNETIASEELPEEAFYLAKGSLETRKGQAYAAWLGLYRATTR